MVHITVIIEANAFLLKCKKNSEQRYVEISLTVEKLIHER